MCNWDTKAALAYHEATKHSGWSIRSSPHRLDWDNKPLPFKIYRGLERFPLAHKFPERDVSPLEAIAWSGASPAERLAQHEGLERIPDLVALSRVLYLAAGVTKRKHHPGGEVYFRAYANTGALYHVDLYLAVADLPELTAGVYHFGPHDFALRRLRDGDWRSVLVEASGANPDLARAPIIVATASTYWRNSWKYQARTWRHCFWDSGTLHANALAAAASEAFEPRLVLGFADRPVERLLGLDPQREGALTLLALGRTTRPPPKVADPAELRFETESLSAREVDYPAIRDAHAASSLADGAEAAAWRVKTPAQAAPAPHAPPIRLLRATEATPSRESLDQLIRRRGSTRAFDPGRALGFEELSTVLDCAARGLPADFLEPHGATLLDLYLIVNAVEGIAPGAYHYRRDEHSLECLRTGNFRDAAGHLGLDQQLPADAAVNVYSLVDLPRVLEQLGNRGYRAAQLEGGIAGGRMYLAAYAQRFGATGLTFYDDEVTQFFSPHAAGKSVMFLTALGHPDRAALNALDL
jgi:SagB-type dehydrogenase family enzyme